MKKIHFFLLNLLISLTISAQVFLYEDSDFKCSYQAKDGQLQGSYTSWYKNGNKKSEGNILNGYRDGKWKVYDSTGHLRVVREYKDSGHSYIQKVYPMKPAKTFTSSYTFDYSRNAEGYYNYFDVKEKMVVWEKRIWRYLSPENNPGFVSVSNLYSILLSNYSAGKITAYKDDDFSKLDTTKYKSSDYKIIGYKIFETSIIDNVRSMLGTWILGICAVVENIKSKDTVDLCWFYYPELRKILAVNNVYIAGSSSTYSFDDAFFFHRYQGPILKEGNVYDRSISSYITDKTGQLRESERIEIGMIEFENNYWLTLAVPKK